MLSNMLYIGMYNQSVELIDYMQFPFWATMSGGKEVGNVESLHFLTFNHRHT